MTSEVLYSFEAHSRQAVEMGQVNANALISIGAPDAPKISSDIVQHQFAGRILHLAFNDLGGDGLLANPSDAHLNDCLTFVKAIPHTSRIVRVAVHCTHGVSRSPAIAISLAAAFSPDEDERTVVAKFLQKRHGQKTTPNPIIIAIADRLLDRRGRIDSALLEACPTYAGWKRFAEQTVLPSGLIVPAGSPAAAGTRRT